MPLKLGVNQQYQPNKLLNKLKK